MGISLWGVTRLGYAPSAKRIPFGNGSGGLTDSADLQWDDSLKCLGINTVAVANQTVLVRGANARIAIQASSGNPAFALRDGGVDQSTWALDGSLNTSLTLSASKIASFIVGVTLTAAFDTNRFRVVRRLNLTRGADVASGGTVTFGNDGTLFQLTGTTAVNFITTTDWQDGSPIYMIAKGAITLNHNTGGAPGSTAAMKIAGAANMALASGDMVVMWYDGTVFRVSRIGATGA